MRKIQDHEAFRLSVPSYWWWMMDSSSWVHLSSVSSVSSPVGSQPPRERTTTPPFVLLNARALSLLAGKLGWERHWVYPSGYCCNAPVEAWDGLDADLHQCCCSELMDCQSVAYLVHNSYTQHFTQMHKFIMNTILKLSESFHFLLDQRTWLEELSFQTILTDCKNLEFYTTWSGILAQPNISVMCDN